jgi:hypothetical protein
VPDSLLWSSPVLGNYSGPLRRIAGITLGFSAYIRGRFQNECSEAPCQRVTDLGQADRGSGLVEFLFNSDLCSD